MKDNRVLVLFFGLLLAFMVGATRMQSYVNGFDHKTGQSDQQTLHSFHLDRTYLRKFTTNLSKFWAKGKDKPSKDDNKLLAAEFDNNSDE